MSFLNLIATYVENHTAFSFSDKSCPAQRGYPNKKYVIVDYGLCGCIVCAFCGLCEKASGQFGFYDELKRKEYTMCQNSVVDINTTTRLKRKWLAKLCDLFGFKCNSLPQNRHEPWIGSLNRTFDVEYVENCGICILNFLRITE